MIKFEIKSRWTGEVKFTAEIEANDETPLGVKIGLAVKWGIEHKANLDGANLYGANLTPIRDDLWAVLSSNPAEVEGLRAAIAEGRIDGSTYTGECACLSGTLHNCAVAAGHADQFDFSGRNADRPIERFFLGIKKGDTPAANPLSKLALEWTDRWLLRVKAAFATHPCSVS
ncbi:MAG TPA: hypothetical protein VFB72_01255 [Verrucomicrobiae bacterium]|nr:hypothetical protein [Verrucomicrobiae bacterium]